MPTGSNTLPEQQYPYIDRYAQSHAYERSALPHGSLSDHWNSGDLNSYNSPYPAYPTKPSFQTHRHHDHIESNEFVGWPHMEGDQKHSHSMLEEPYARGYSSTYNDSRGYSYGYIPDQSLMYTNGLDSPQLAKTPSGSWAHSNGPMLPLQRSLSHPSTHSRWIPTDDRSDVPDSTQWNDVVYPCRDQYESKSSIHHNMVENCSPLSSSISSPSPSPSPVQFSSSLTSKTASRQPSSDRKPITKICSHCHATSTPLWRREPGTQKPLCNACGLYLQQRNKLRPQELIDADIEDNSSDASAGDGTGPECSHCHTHNTSVWRRSKTGEQLCNACGVYSRLRGKDRPLSLKRNKIKPRTKHAPKQP